MTGLSIGQVAAHAGVRASALRYYEQVGLLPPPVRCSGRRSYDSRVFDRLTLIACARRVGFTIAETKLLVAGYTPEITAAARWRELGGRKERELDALIARARQMRRELRAVMACRCKTVDECGRRLRARA